MVHSDLYIIWSHNVFSIWSSVNLFCLYLICWDLKFGITGYNPILVSEMRAGADVYHSRSRLDSKHSRLASHCTEIWKKTGRKSFIVNSYESAPLARVTWVAGIRCFFYIPYKELQAENWQKIMELLRNCPAWDYKTINNIPIIVSLAHM